MHFNKKLAIESALQIGGGAAAGYVSAKYPDKTLWTNGPGYGTAIAAGGLALGLLGIGGRFGQWAGDIGAGAAAFEVGKMVAAKTAAAPGSAVRGVGALPSGRHVSQSDIRAALRDLASV